MRIEKNTLVLYRGKDYVVADVDADTYAIVKADAKPLKSGRVRWIWVKRSEIKVKELS